MAAAQGYIGRNPADSSTVIARQSFSPTGIQTDFTFAAGYDVGYVDLYLNGARLVEGQDFTATDGSTVGLTTNAVNGDVLEVVAFKAFNATSVSAAAGNFTVGGTLDVTGATTLNAALSVSGNTTVGTGITLDTNGNVNVSGVVTANSFVGDGTQLTGVGGGSVISGITIREEGSVVGTSGTVVNVNFVGADVTATAQAGFSTITIAGGGKFINFTDGGSTGITTTAKTKIDDDFNVTGVGTFASRVSIGDSIFHVGDDNTAFGFPAADTFTVYTAGSERLRVDSAGRMGLGVEPSNFGSGRTVLEIHSDSSTVSHLSLTNSATGSNGSSNGFNIIQNSNDALLFLRESGNITFSTNNSEKLRITSGGDVGIGTDVPDALLHVFTNTSSSDTSEPVAIFECDTSAGGDVSIRLEGGASSNPDEIYVEFCDKDDSSNSWAIGLDDDAGHLYIGNGTKGTMNAHTQIKFNKAGGANFSGIATASQLFEGSSRVATAGKAVAMALVFG